MSFLTAGQLAQQGDFKLRVKIAMITAAQAIQTETQTNKMDYQKRNAFAVLVLNEPDFKLDAFAFGVASNPAITSGSLDSDIQFTVNSIFPSYAGVKPNDNTVVVP